MASELRRIIFTHTELRSALDDYFAGRQTPLPLGVIMNVQLEGAGQGVVLVSMAGATDNDQSMITLAPEQVAAALLKFCRTSRIPVPKNASKSLSISGDTLALDIRSGEPLPMK